MNVNLSCISTKFFVEVYRKLWYYYCKVYTIIELFNEYVVIENITYYFKIANV